MNKRVLIVIFFIFIVVALLFMFFSNKLNFFSVKNHSKVQIYNNSKTLKSTNNSLNPSLQIEIQNNYNKNNLGSIINEFNLDTNFSNYYLSCNSIENFNYSNNFPCDTLILTTTSNGKFHNKVLFKGKLIHLYTFNGSPFVHTTLGYIFIFNTGKNIFNQTIPGQGYIYLFKNSQLSLFYKTPFPLTNAYVDSSNNLFLILKQSINPLGSYPVPLEPYNLYTYEFENNQFVEVSSYQYFPHFNSSTNSITFNSVS